MEKRQYEKLIVWQESHALCLQIYKVTRSFPPEEKYGLTHQMRRSAYSIPTNIAEGNSRRSVKDKLHFIDIATCSLEELHYQCILSRDLQYVSNEIYVELKDHIQRIGYLLHKLHASFN